MAYWFLDKKALTRIQAVIIAVIIIVAAVAGAAYYSILPGPEEAGTELRYGWVSDVITMDPAVGWSTDSISMIRACYDTLIRLNGSSMDIEPYLAESWSVSTDGIEYTFNLRENVTFVDGSPFNATAVKKSFDRLLGIGQQSGNFPIEETVILDTYTVKFVLESSFAPFLSALATMQGSIVNPNAVEKHKTAEDPWAMDWFHDYTNGTGPYLLDEWRKGEGWTMLKNTHYWRGWEGQHLDKLTGIIITEPATMRMMLEKGDIDISCFITREVIPELQLNPFMKIVEYPALSLFYLCFNTQKPPLDDVHVRRAISYAIDYSQGLALILYHGTQSRGALPSALWGWSEETFQYNKDMEKARGELSLSQYPDGGFTLTYLWCTGAWEERRVGELLQSCLSELNIDVVIEEQTWATLTATTTNPETARDIVALFDFVTAPDCHFTLAERFHSSRIPPGGYNWDYYNNSAVDTLLDEAMREIDREKRADLYHQVDEILVDEAVCGFMWEETKIVSMGSWVHGFVPNPCLVETFNFYDMYTVENEKP